jgi:hypothetical protein
VVVVALWGDFLIGMVFFIGIDFCLDDFWIGPCYANDVIFQSAAAVYMGCTPLYFT